MVSGLNSSESPGTLTRCLLELTFALTLDHLKLSQFALSSPKLGETRKHLIMLLEVSCRANKTQTPDGVKTILG